MSYSNTRTHWNYVISVQSNRDRDSQDPFFINCTQWHGVLRGFTSTISFPWYSALHILIPIGFANLDLIVMVLHWPSWRPRNGEPRDTYFLSLSLMLETYAPGFRHLRNWRPIDLHRTGYQEIPQNENCPGTPASSPLFRLRTMSMFRYRE